MLKVSETWQPMVGEWWTQNEAVSSLEFRPQGLNNFGFWMCIRE